MAEAYSGWLGLSNDNGYRGCQVQFYLSVTRTNATTVRVLVQAQTRPVSTTWWDSTRPSLSCSGSVTGSVTGKASSDQGLVTIYDGSVTSQAAYTPTVNCYCYIAALGGVPAGDKSYTFNSVGVSAGYSKPSPPTMTGHSSSNGYQTTITFNTNATSSAPVAQTNIDSYSLPQSGGATATGGQASVSSPWSTAGTKNGAVMVRRVASKATSDGAWQYSAWSMLLQAPTTPSGLSVVQNGAYGATIKWTNNHNKTDYYTYIYEGTVSVAANGKLSVGTAKLLATIAPGTSQWSSTSIWSSGSAYSSKKFSVVQVSSYAAWTRSDKASYATYGYIEGFASGILTATLSNGLAAPSAATNVSAENVFSGSYVDSSKVKITFSAPASTTNNPRTGWRIYNAAGTLVDTFTDTTAGSKTRTISVDIANISDTYTVYAYGSAGQSSGATSNTVYGRFDAPEKISFVRDGDEISVSVVDPFTGGYAHISEIGYSYDGETWIFAERNSIAINGSAYTKNKVYLRARIRPNTSAITNREPYSSPYVEDVVLEGCDPVDSVIAVQDNNYPDGSHCVVTWPPVKENGVEVAESYIIQIRHPDGTVVKAGEVNADGSPTYTYDFLYMGSEEVEVEVVAVRNGWKSKPTGTPFSYNPQYLEPPVLLSVEHLNEYYYKVTYLPATGGIQYNGGSEDAGYLYSAYINGVRSKYQEPPATEIISNNGVHEMVIRIVSPKTVYIRLAATDERKRSVLSNSFAVQHHARGVGMFAYGCRSLKFDDVIIEGVKTAVMISGGTELQINNSTLNITEDGKFYEMDTDSNVVEVNCEYE